MIIHRAFIREILQTSGAVTVILFSIFFVIRLVGFLGEAAEGDVAIESVFLLLFLKAISYLDIILPLVVYISIILVLGRWIRDNELTVISACGVGMAQFMKPLLVLFLIIGTTIGAFSLYIAPLSVQAGHDITLKYRSRSEVTGIVPGVFNELRGGNGVYFVGHNDVNGKFQEIFVYSSDEKEEGVVVAETGYKVTDKITNDDFLVLNNGTQYQRKAGDNAFAIVNFETYGVRLKQRIAQGHKPPIKARPTAILLDGSIPRSIAEFHWRFAKIFMLLVLMLFALCFSSITYRKARFPAMLMALSVYFIYSNSLGITIALIHKKVIPAHSSLWIVNLTYLTIAAYMFYRRSQNYRLIPGLPSK